MIDRKSKNNYCGGVNETERGSVVARQSPRALSRVVANNSEHARTRDFMLESGVGMLCSQS